MEVTGSTNPIYKRPEAKTSPCACQPGYYLKVVGDHVKCEKCPIGKYSDGTSLRCYTCKDGSAAIPGYFLSYFSADGIPNSLKQSCSGDFCKVRHYYSPLFSLKRFHNKKELPFFNHMFLLTEEILSNLGCLSVPYVICL